jgi:hypothetical protein
MTLRQIAGAAHLSLDTINRILKMEHPKVNPTTFCSLAQGLNLTPAELDACLNEPKPATSLTPEQAAALLERSPGSAPGRSEADQSTNLRRQVHAITDLLGFDGLKRLHSLAQQELRQQVNHPQGGSGGPQGAAGSSGSTGQPGARRAAKPAGPRTHSITNVPSAADLHIDSRGTF